MNRLYIFVIRAILGMVFAVIIVRFFYPGVNIIYVAGLAVFMIGMAYILEYWRSRKSEE